MSDLNQKLREVVAHAYANAPAVKARFDDAGIKPDDIQTIADLVKLPIYHKDQLVVAQQENPPFGGFLAVPKEKVSRIFFSPGPLYEPGTGDGRVWDMANYMLNLAGFEAGDIVLNSLSYHLVPAGLAVDLALVNHGCTVVPGGVGNSDLQLKMMKDLGATGYAGTPSFLMSLIKKAEEMGMDFRRDFKLKKALVSAEPLPPSLRQALEGYGISVANGYGTAEFGIVAMDIGKGPVPLSMQLLPEPIVELLDPETGQPVGPGEAGEVVITNFSHEYPMLRLGTGDMAMNIDPNPGQSKQEERFIVLVGRSGDAVKVRGMFMHPNQIRFAMGQFPNVGGAQAVITRPELRDHVVLRVVLTDGSDDAGLVEPIKQAVTAVCRVKIDEVEFVDEIEEGARGVLDNRKWD